MRLPVLRLNSFSDTMYSEREKRNTGPLRPLKHCQQKREKTMKKTLGTLIQKIGQPKKAKPLGWILYEGPSQLDGAPIVVIATRGSSNSKTGDLVQTWIMRSDIKPVDATKTGDDSSICGDCPHRHYSGGACYVQVFQAPRSVYDAYKRGRYKRLDDQDVETLQGLKVRAGSYGDPAAVPAWIWVLIGVHAGYSRQWRSFQDQSHYLMASVVSLAEKAEANALGFRTFRMASEESPIASDEILCPSAIGVSCFDCGLCGGSRVGAKNIVIPVHGARKKRALTVIQ